MRRRLGEARVGRLATVAPAGSPHVVPCCFALDRDRIVAAVDAKPKSTLALARLANQGRPPPGSPAGRRRSTGWRPGTGSTPGAGPGAVVVVEVDRWRGWP